MGTGTKEPPSTRRVVARGADPRVIDAAEAAIAVLAGPLTVPQRKSLRRLLLQVGLEYYEQGEASGRRRARAVVEAYEALRRAATPDRAPVTVADVTALVRVGDRDVRAGEVAAIARQVGLLLAGADED